MTSLARSYQGLPSPTHGPRGSGLEFLLTGGATLVLWPSAWLLQQALGLEDAEFVAGFLTFYLAFVVNDPHFAVSYLLFYRNVRARALGQAWGRVQTVRYWLAGFVVPLALLGWAGAALVLDSSLALGWMIQVMFLLVGWHYVKQGFGVLSVLSARRGVTFSRTERGAVLLHCYLGWAYAWASPAQSALDAVEKGVWYTAWPRPAELEQVTGLLFAASGVALFAVLGRRWQWERSLPLVPLLGLLVTVWLWVVFSAVDPVMIYLIPGLHSVQYLNFVWLLERNRARHVTSQESFRSVAQQLGRTLLLALGLGWLLFHGAPTFLDETVGRTHDGAGGLGATPYFAALFTIVNLHHYFMDFVIWRRDNAETRFLLDDGR